MDHLPLEEWMIVTALLDAAFDRGLLVSVYESAIDGDALAVGPTDNRLSVEREIGLTAVTTLRFRSHDVDLTGHYPVAGQVTLVHGDGLDVVFTATDNRGMDDLLGSAMDLRDKLKGCDL